MSVPRSAFCVLALCLSSSSALGQISSAVLPERSPSQPASSEQTTQSAPDTYDGWMAGYKKGPLTGALSDKHKIELAVSVVDDDIALDPAMKQVAISEATITTLALSTAGTVSMIRYTPLAIQGGGPSAIPKADFKRLEELMKQLPDDRSWLPPKGRRLVVQVETGKGILAQVYDRANLPETAIDIADLLGADTWPLYQFPRFEPDSRWKESLYSVPVPGTIEKKLDAEERVLATSPDRRMRVTEINPFQWFDTTVKIENLKSPARASCHFYPHSFYPYNCSTLRIDDAQTGNVIHEFREPVSGPYMYAAQFTPDARFLLVLSDIPDLRIYDTTTWEKVDGLQSVPVGALAYDPAPDWKHGVVVFPSGEIDLIDADSGRKIAQIDPGNELQSVAYSPDGSRVAIATANYDSENDLPDHLRIWETATGRMLHELRPLEGTPRDGFGAPFWWSDGKYLFVLTREGSYGGAIIGIWNTESGRYRGGLTGCSVPGTEYPLILEDGKFHIDCDHEVLMWEAKGALERIADFERSLTH